MARVRPFAAYRYAGAERDISTLTAPPYDVISPDQRAQLLAGNPHNVVALELPEGPLDPAVPGNRYENGAAAWNAWREQGVLVQDAAPAVYVLEQLTQHDDRAVRRRAFIVEVGLEPFSAGVVLPHERTLPKALGDRFELIRATRANMSQVLGLFDDPNGATDALFAAIAVGEPIATATDADKVELNAEEATPVRRRTRGRQMIPRQVPNAEVERHRAQVAERQEHPDAAGRAQGEDGTERTVDGV